MHAVPDCASEGSEIACANVCVDVRPLICGVGGSAEAGEVLDACRPSEAPGEGDGVLGPCELAGAERAVLRVEHGREVDIDSGSAERASGLPCAANAAALVYDRAGS
jgi:hypothetical protein